LLPFKGTPLYPLVKKEAETKLGVPTQCVVLDPKKLNRTVLGNIVAGVNPKTGGVNARLPLTDQLKALVPGGQGQWCIMGLDVDHGKTSSVDKPSIAALVTFLDSNCTIPHTDITRQDPLKEIVSDLDKMAIQGLAEFQKYNIFLPSRLLFYRDGIGEGMYDIVCREEISGLMAALPALYGPQPLPLLTFLVVQKRNHFRSAWIPTPGGPVFNPPPGTVVDKVVTDSKSVNFYLYSHKALAGTARPTHYQLILDENKVNLRALEELTFALAHLHQGCTKSVSIPAPVFYADRACGRAGQCYRNEGTVKPQLINTAYMI